MTQSEPAKAMAATPCKAKAPLAVQSVPLSEKVKDCELMMSNGEHKHPQFKTLETHVHEFYLASLEDSNVKIDMRSH